MLKVLKSQVNSVSKSSKSLTLENEDLKREYEAHLNLVSKTWTSNPSWIIRASDTLSSGWKHKKASDKMWINQWMSHFNQLALSLHAKSQKLTHSNSTGQLLWGSSVKAKEIMYMCHQGRKSWMPACSLKRTPSASKDIFQWPPYKTKQNPSPSRISKETDLWMDVPLGLIWKIFLGRQEGSQAFLIQSTDDLDRIPGI